MAKFHINSKGEAGKCFAVQGGCPFGGEASHYPSEENARTAFELSMASENFKSVSGPSKPKRFLRPKLNSGGKAYAARAKEVNDVLNLALTSAEVGASFTAKHRNEAKEIHSVMEVAYDEVNDPKLDSLAVADKLADNFMKIAARRGKSLERIDKSELRTAADHAALAYVSPRIHSAAAAFEDSLVKRDWITTMSGGKTPREFAQVFITASQQAGPDASAEELAESFKVQADAGGWALDDDEEENVNADMLQAAKAAISKINADREQYAQELKATA
jgi:hypothetical protein